MPTATTARPQQSLFRAILFTWLLAGTLDGLAAIIQYTLKGGKTPQVIFKYIASAALDKNTVPSDTLVLAGIGFHYLIALLFTIFFFLIFRPAGLKRFNKYLVGFIYGLVVWAIMNRIVVPLSRLGASPFHLDKALIAAGILVLCIGMPVSLMANKYYLYKK